MKATLYNEDIYVITYTRTLPASLIKMKENNKINQVDIFQSVKSDAINELTPEILETGLGLLIESDVLKDIPVFGIAFKGYSLYKKLTETFFTKKLLNFLFELKDIPQFERENFISELESKKETSKAGEKLLITLNRLNDTEKAAIIGRLFKKTILGKIEFNDFNRLSYIIDNTYIEDLESLKNNEYLQYISDEIKSNLHQIGLLNQSIKDNRKREKYLSEKIGHSEIIPPTFEYKLNIYGKILIDYGFE